MNLWTLNTHNIEFWTDVMDWILKHDSMKFRKNRFSAQNHTESLPLHYIVISSHSLKDILTNSHSLITRLSHCLQWVSFTNEHKSFFDPEKLKFFRFFVPRGQHYHTRHANMDHAHDGVRQWTGRGRWTKVDEDEWEWLNDDRWIQIARFQVD